MSAKRAGEVEPIASGSGSGGPPTKEKEPPSKKLKVGVSVIWDFFTIEHDDNAFVTCNLCGMRLKRGKTPAVYSTKGEFKFPRGCGRYPEGSGPTATKY